MQIGLYALYDHVQIGLYALYILMGGSHDLYRLDNVHYKYTDGRNTTYIGMDNIFIMINI
jgi:hypothetical protein